MRSNHKTFHNMKAKQIFRVFRFKYYADYGIAAKKGRPENHLETNIKQQIANITLAKWKNFIASPPKCGIAHGVFYV